MAKVCLSENSLMDRLMLKTGNGMSEITRNDSCSLSPTKAMIYYGDPNLLITFEEQDRAELKNLDGKLRSMALEAFKVEDCPSSILPKKSVAKKATKKVKEAVKSVITTEEQE